MRKPILIVDTNIPFIAGRLEAFADVRYLLPSQITPDTVKDADGLIIRTRTRCDSSLLAKSNVRFIATATIGYDHIDTEYCRKKEIRWTNVAGCNASSVAQYILSALFRLSLKNKEPLQNKTIGIIGIGHVGSIIDAHCRALGIKVLKNDPPRQAIERGDEFVPLSVLTEQADIITFHTPLIAEGEYKTIHMGDDRFFKSLKRSPIIINSSRGEVVNNIALTQAIEKKTVSDAVIDCWETEPSIYLPLMKACFIATPHIAGYSADGKMNATKGVLQATGEYFGFSPDLSEMTPPLPKERVIDLDQYIDHRIARAILTTYDVTDDSNRLKTDWSQFESLRSHYPLRREAAAYHILNGTEEERKTLQQIGFNLLLK